jgi:hypothetical protein
MDELLQSSRLSQPLVAQNSILVQGHVMLKPLYELYKKFTWGPIFCTSAWKPFLCPVKAAATSVQVPTQFAQEIPYAVKQSFTALNISLPVHLSESGRQNMNSSWMFSSK